MNHCFSVKVKVQSKARKPLQTIYCSSIKIHNNILYFFLKTHAKGNLEVYKGKFTSHEPCNLLLIKQIIQLSINSRVTLLHCLVLYFNQDQACVCVCVCVFSHYVKFLSPWLTCSIKDTLYHTHMQKHTERKGMFPYQW